MEQSKIIDTLETYQLSKRMTLLRYPRISIKQYRSTPWNPHEESREELDRALARRRSDLD